MDGSFCKMFIKHGRSLQFQCRVMVRRISTTTESSGQTSYTSQCLCTFEKWLFLSAVMKLITVLWTVKYMAYYSLKKKFIFSWLTKCCGINVIKNCWDVMLIMCSLSISMQTNITHKTLGSGLCFFFGSGILMVSADNISEVLFSPFDTIQPGLTWQPGAPCFIVLIYFFS